MNKYKTIIKESVYEYEYKVFDNVYDYLSYITQDSSFEIHIRDIDRFSRIIINDEAFYSLYDFRRTEVLTEKAFKEMFNNVEYVYTIHENNLIRTQKKSNTRFTGDQPTKEKVMEYMRDDKKSWLPQIYKEINAEINEIKKQAQEKINKLEQQKNTLLDDEYLKSKIKTGIIIKAEKLL